MNKNDFMGFKQVFLFEFMTGIQKPAFKFFLVVVCVIAFFGTPLMVIIGNSRGGNSDEEGFTKSVIESAYVYDETGLSIDYSGLNKSDKYTDVSFITDNAMSYDDAIENLKQNPGRNDIVIKNEYDSNDRFYVTIVHSGKSSVKSSDLKSFEEDYTEFFRNDVLKNLGVSDEDYEYMSKGFEITVMKTAKDGSFVEDTSAITLEDYSTMLGGLFILFMLINLAAGNVSTSIATEKSSRVIEYLLTGTRPLALLSGKIVARLTETLITSLAAYSCYILSQIVTVFLLAGEISSEGASSNVVAVAGIWQSITLSKMIIAVLYFLAGLALFSIIGALAGASVSKLEELQDAYKLYSFVLVISVYIDMALIIMMLNSSGMDSFQTFCAMFPLTGPFLTPTLVLTGRISVMTGLIALIIILITAVATFILAAAVYESMLLYQGKRLTIKDVIALMKKQVVT